MQRASRITCVFRNFAGVPDSVNQDFREQILSDTEPRPFPSGVIFGLAARCRDGAWLDGSLFRVCDLSYLQ